LEINPPSLKPRIHLMASHLSTSPATFGNRRIIAIFTKPLALTSCLIQRGERDAPNLRIAGGRRLLPAQEKFADGTVLVKEVFGTDHAQMTTGDAHWAKDTKVWFVLIKDSKGRYPNNPLWGDGWGWALLNPMHLTSRSRLPTRRTASAATPLQKPTTGFT
jgi:hypothetical protein